MNILIAEDDAVGRRLLEAAVERAGHTFRSATDGKEAWTLFCQEAADVIISDWSMPHMDGLALLSAVRERERGTTTYTYVLLATALDDRQHMLAAMSKGADDYLTKPLNRVELDIRLEVAARVMSLQRQLETHKLELEVEKDRLLLRIRELEKKLTVFDRSQV